MDQDPLQEAQNTWVLSVLGVQVGTDEPPVELGEDDLPAADEDGYRKYLIRKLKQVRTTGEANFGFVLGRQGPEHRMALHHSAGAKTLAAKLVRTTGLHRVTWGVATPDPDRPTTLRVAVEGHMLPGLRKQGNRMLRAFKPLPFARITLWADGTEVTDPDGDAEGGMDAPMSVLPEPYGVATPQSRVLEVAAQRHAALCEECPPY